MQELNKNTLEVNNVTMCFQDSPRLFHTKREKKVLDGVSFRIMQGEAYGLIGESGCGKSTLARIIMGAYQPDQGEIRLGGRRIDHLSAKEFQVIYGDIQMIFQDSYTSLNPSMTAARMIEEPMAVRKMYGKAQRKEKVHMLMEQMGFTVSDLGRYPHEFSGGQRQKIAVARALAVEPGILICDEPLASLDLLTKSQMIDLLNRIRMERGMSFLYISHEMEEVKRICSRMGVMNAGKIIEERRLS